MPADLADGDDDTLADLGCASGESVQWDGTGWTCVTGGGDTTLSTAESAALASGSSITVTTGSASPNIIAMGWVQDAAGVWIPVAPVSGPRTTECADCGDGSSGEFSMGSGATVTLSSGEYNYTHFDLPSYGTIRATGTTPLIIRSQNPVTIAGTIDLRGAAGTDAAMYSTGVAGTGAVGGYSGGSPYSPYGGCIGCTASAGGGPGGGSGSVCGGGGTGGAGSVSTALTVSSWFAWSNVLTSNFIGGSGGGGGCQGYWGATGGGAGGGAILIVAPSVTVSGSIDVRGGRGGIGMTNGYGPGGTGTGGAGGGGSVWLRGANVIVSGSVSVGSGILRVDAHESTLASSTTATASGTTTGLPGSIDIRQVSDGVVRLTNYRTTAQAVRLVVAH